MKNTAFGYSPRRHNITKQRQGFTLIELLVVIAIIIILSLAAWIVINPIEILKQGRDSVRIGSLTSLNQAIQSAVNEATGSAAVNPLCNGAAGSCTGDSTVGGNGAMSNNGSGWVKVNLSNSTLKLPTIPVDPTNSGSFKFLYGSDGTDWELDAQLESAKYITKMTTDGGSSNTEYEVGTKFDIIP